MNKEANRMIIYTVVLAVLTAVFRLFNLDIIIQNMFFDFSANTWKYADNPFVLMLYKYGTYPALLLVSAAFVVFILGFAYEKLRTHRKAALFIILTMLIAPGLVTNVILKNYAGRPRPRDVKEFNGKMDFRQPLELGLPGRGFSFPCGHCTMGFFFYTVYLLLRKKHKSASLAAAGGAFVYGTAMGIGRMAQGGHFATDVLWAAGITLITAEVLHVFVIKTETQGGIFEKIRVKNRPAAYLAAVVFLIITAFVFLIATPFNKNREYPAAFFSGAEIITNRADIKADSARQGLVKFQASGFGLPWSDYDDFIKTDGSLIYMASSHGLFSELNSSIDVYFEAGTQQAVSITAGAGNISYISENPCSFIYLNSEKGRIEFSPKGKTQILNLVILAADGDVVLKFPETLKFAANALIDIKAPNGSVFIKNSSGYFKDINKEALKLNGSKELRFKSLIKGAPAMSISAKAIQVETVK